MQLARWLGIKEWQLRRAQNRGLVPPPDLDDRRWSAAVAESLPDRVEEILAEVGDRPGLGSEKAAEFLAQRSGLDVERVDVQNLAERGALRPVGNYRGWPLYGIKDLETFPDDLLRRVVAERLDWMTSSLASREAADLLG